MEFFNVVSINEARKIIEENFKEFDFKLEYVDIENASNRYLAENIYSSINVPQFNRSTVDGYSIKVEDSHGANSAIPSILNILGKVKMGEAIDYNVENGQAYYVPTGGMVPDGANGMILIENTEKMVSSTLLLYKPISQGDNIISKCDDIREGELALEKGRLINSEVIGVLAALGIGKVPVFVKPKFHIISTGDEIISIEEELTLGKIRDINSYTLTTLIQNMGGQVVGKAIVKDNYDLLQSELRKAIDISDVVLISGGSSVGTKDYTHKVIDSFNGKGVLFHGLGIKPGKPTILGEANGKMVFGLPGHVVSSIVVFKAIIEYYIKNKFGSKEITPRVHAIIDQNFPSNPGLETYQMVKLLEKEGKFYATPTFGKSGMISLLSNSQGYIIIGSHEEGINKGEEREVFLL